MGKPVTSNVKRVETTGLNTKVNKEVLTKFKDGCAYRGYQMNVVIETFMQQYANDRFDLNHDDIMKWKRDESEIDLLNSSFNKEIYLNFKNACKKNGYFIKHVITAFMEQFVSNDYILEYVHVSNINKDKEVESE